MAIRTYLSLNQGWSFCGPQQRWVPVDLPHTWNAEDGQDGGNDYWRGSCTYVRNFPTPDFDADSQVVYLEFHGVNATADVEVNGQRVAHHDGGYSTFRAEVTRLLQAENTLTVRVDNSVNDRVYPQKADFTFYGGIYRDVNLLVVSREHFDLDYYGGSGLRVTPTVRGDTGTVRVECWVTPEHPDITVTVTDREGQTVAQGQGSDMTLTIPQVHRWEGVKDPYLYTATARLRQNGTVVDEVSCRFGVRDFRVDPEKGFFLNGRSYPLRGVARHQDWKGLGNALTKEHHRRDVELILEVGANAVRLAHYQHDQYFYDLCDEYGLIVWAEIPYISEHLPHGRKNTLAQMTELIVQNYNHPSIVTWGLSNEITISTKDKAGMLKNHRELNDLCHAMDATRPTSLACYAMCPPVHPSAHIPDLVGWNLYLGWYVPGLRLNDAWIRIFHWMYPKRPLCYSEYGCEGMPNLHSSKPSRGDHSEEYQAIYHEFMLQCFARHPYLWGNFVWNMFDFAADARDQGGEAGRNHKGLVTFDRQTKKDSFYLYKAHWNQTEPFVHLCSRRYVERPEWMTLVKVYSNQSQVTLYANGIPVDSQQGGPVFRFRVPLTGEVTLRAVAGDCEDTCVIRHVDKPNPAYRLNKGNSTSANWV